jgi:hypothetical protein
MARAGKRLQTRLAGLERKHGIAAGRCPQCRGRPGIVLQTLRREAPEAEPMPAPEEREQALPCPGCGWRPLCIQILEVVVDSTWP